MLDTKDNKAYIVKRIEVGNGRKEIEDNKIKNVEIDESSTPTNVTLKFKDNKLKKIKNISIQYK